MSVLLTVMRLMYVMHWPASPFDETKMMGNTASMLQGVKLRWRNGKTHPSRHAASGNPVSVWAAFTLCFHSYSPWVNDYVLRLRKCIWFVAVGNKKPRPLYNDRGFARQKRVEYLHLSLAERRHRSSFNFAGR